MPDATIERLQEQVKRLAQELANAKTFEEHLGIVIAAHEAHIISLAAMCDQLVCERDAARREAGHVPVLVG